MTPGCFHTLDSSGRSLHWVLIQRNRGSGMMSNRLVHADLDTPDARIRLSPHQRQNDLTDRPRFHEEGVFLELTNELNDWLVEVQYEYQPEFRWSEHGLGVHVGFRDKSQAVHFKLAWGI